jgi:hypothetical protein
MRSTYPFCSDSTSEVPAEVRRLIETADRIKIGTHWRGHTTRILDGYAARGMCRTYEAKSVGFELRAPPIPIR